MKRNLSIAAVVMSFVAGTVVCLGFSGNPNRDVNKPAIITELPSNVVYDNYSEIDGPSPTILAINDCYDDAQFLNRTRLQNIQSIPSEFSPIPGLSSQNA